MKKVYKKPMIMFESFASSVNIAGDCEVKTNTPNTKQCGLDWYGDNVLFLDIEGTLCKGEIGLITPGPGGDDGFMEGPFGEHDMLCYHVPNKGLNNLFNS